MNKTLNTSDISKKENNKSKFRCFIDRQSDKLKNHQFRCPVCRESFQGISALGSHLKDHCT